MHGNNISLHAWMFNSFTFLMMEKTRFHNQSHWVNGPSRTRRYGSPIAERKEEVKRDSKRYCPESKNAWNPRSWKHMVLSVYTYFSFSWNQRQANTHRVSQFIACFMRRQQPFHSGTSDTQIIIIIILPREFLHVFPY